MQQVVIVHLSDTHFGPDLLNARFGWIPGYREHDVVLLTGFQRALRNVKRIIGCANVLVQFLHTGDVTATGAPGEFSAADLYFRGSRPLNFNRSYVGNTIGLDLSDQALVGIPGNHDHWGGIRFSWHPFNASIFGRYFRSMPWVREIPGLPPNNVAHVGRRLRVNLYAVDSNSGLRDGSRVDSMRAKGSIAADEFERLEAKLSAESLPDPSVVTVRALVVHHPLSISSKLRILSAGSLEPESVARLLQIAARHRIFAVLTGHTHRFSYLPYDCAEGSGEPSDWKLYELRSATTLQGPESERTQGFIVHQIVAHENVVTWKAWQFRWDGRAFQCTYIQPNNQPWWQQIVPT